MTLAMRAEYTPLARDGGKTFELIGDDVHARARPADEDGAVVFARKHFRRDIARHAVIGVHVIEIGGAEVVTDGVELHSERLRILGREKTFDRFFKQVTRFV